jgi:hypothetical protein
MRSPCRRLGIYSAPLVFVPNGKAPATGWKLGPRGMCFRQPTGKEALALNVPDRELVPSGSVPNLIFESGAEQTTISYRSLNFGVMGKAEGPICPNCGALLILALPPDGKGKRTFQCFDCDRPDPLKTDRMVGWLKSELQPPK